MKSFNSQNTNKINLLQLVWLRLAAIFGQIITIIFVHYFLEISLPLRQMFAVIGALSLANLISFLRCKSQLNIGNKSLFAELLFDVFALTAQLYLSGGVSNPFISLFLIQVIIGAILLSPTYSWAIALVTILCYVWLSFNYQELHGLHHETSDDFFNLHLQGMLIGYVFAAILLLIFVTKIIKNLKERDRQIYLLKQQSIEKEQLVRMGLFATSAAHELSTPLSTISVIISDWKKMSFAKDVLADIDLINSQIVRCKKILSEILFSSGSARLESAQKKPAQKVFDSLVDEWRILRLPKNLIYNFSGSCNKEILLSSDLSFAFFNIFDNALEESKDWVSIFVEIVGDELLVIVEDSGKGFDKKILEKIGRPNVTNKIGNRGFGLFLAITSFKAVGGSLEILNKKNGGTKVKITIPVRNL